ncbi:MAG TPA: hypothetical protein PKO25_03900 [Spirochaetota bacterium]|nr:hypothetical protein [Spirochaetota bacterium]HPI15304.1 hypothetical protein [Spirochaetota bacterium]HPO44580.1 hypothetical protein [Spirochaetota bacterium]
MEAIDRFTFLDETSLREPYILEVLNEIYSLQGQSLPSGIKSLATLETLKKSRNVKIPISPKRDKTVEYLVEYLASRFPEHVRQLITFDFQVDESTKRLSVNEAVEFAVMLNTHDYERLCSIRDERSMENLLAILQKYRFFNLSKLLKVARSKKDLSRVIAKEEGRQYFVFKSSSLDRNKAEVEEDYCFHARNYPAARDSINLNRLKEITGRYSELVMRRLKRFGILSDYVSDYRDPKLDYIFNILIGDIASSLDENDRIDAKNIHSLRACVMSAEKSLDPSKTLERDIARFIGEQRVCASSDIVGSILELTDEVLEKWSTPENMRANSVLSYVSDDGTVYYVDGAGLMTNLAELAELVLRSPEKFAEYAYSERQRHSKHLEILCRTARTVLSSLDKKADLRLSADDIEKLKAIIAEYEEHLKKLRQREEAARRSPISAQKPSLWVRIVNFFKRLFGGHGSERVKSETAPGEPPVAAPPREARQVYKKIAAQKGPIFALSDFIELVPENDALVDHLIQDMRENGLRIVIPIYNAREVLYPKRSQKLLMPDTEYLLSPAESARTPESIRRYTDTLVGFKIKDEVMPARAIMAVEKYLLTHYRQKRAQMLKREL